MKHNLLLLSCLFLFWTATFAQTAASGNHDWKLLQTKKNVVVSYETADCSAVNSVYLKITNNNNYAVSVDISLWGSKTPKSVSIKPNETISGECTNLLPLCNLVQMIPEGKSVSDIGAIITITEKK